MKRLPLFSHSQLTILCLFILLFTLIGCSQSNAARSVNPIGRKPERTCAVEPPSETTAVSDTKVNLQFNISSQDIDKTLKIYQDDQLIYECTHVVADELTGAGHGFNVIIDREGELFRFEADGDLEVWEEMIVPAETELYTNYEDRTFEYHYVFAGYNTENGWSVYTTADHPGFE